MYELPLFPLNAVLFPGTPITLHVFEKRYRRMMRHCLDKQAPFGVVLIQEGEEVGGAAEPHRIGCTAHIQQVEPLADGRMNLLAVGRERFRIHDLRRDKPYLVGVVEACSLVSKRSPVIETLDATLRPMVSQYLAILSRIGEVDLDDQKLPSDPLSLGYLAAFLLRVPSTQKQAVLAADRVDQVLEQINSLYQQELLLTASLPHDSQGPFSFN